MKQKFINIRVWLTNKLVERGLDLEAAKLVSKNIKGTNLKLPFVGNSYGKPLYEVCIELGLKKRKFDPITELNICEGLFGGPYVREKGLWYLGENPSDEEIIRLCEKKYGYKNIDDLKVAQL